MFRLTFHFGLLIKSGRGCLRKRGFSEIEEATSEDLGNIYTSNMRGEGTRGAILESLLKF